MVAAYLRGLLRKDKHHGLRTISTEDIVLESISAEILAGNVESSLQVDLALMPLLTEKGIHNTISRASSRLERAAELRLLDIYKVGEQVSGALKLGNVNKELSLFQLYQIAEKSGIFEAFDEHYTEENSTPLL